MDADLEQSLSRLLFANIITSLETFLSDTFINVIFGDERLMQRFVETTSESSKRSFKYSEIYEVIDGLPRVVKEYLTSILWHNLPKVKSMYKDTLDIDFGISEVSKAIPIRHDIVHRNGKQKDGVLVIIRKEDIEELLQNVEKMVNEIDGQVRGIESNHDENDAIDF